MEIYSFGYDPGADLKVYVGKKEAIIEKKFINHVHIQVPPGLKNEVTASHGGVITEVFKINSGDIGGIKNLVENRSMNNPTATSLGFTN